MTPNMHARASTVPKLAKVAAGAIAHLTTLGGCAETSTMDLAVLLGVSRAYVVAGLVPAQARGQVASRAVRGRLMWRLERRA